MIVPMTRYNFLLFHTDVATFLENIREVGLVDITTTAWHGTPEEMAVFERSEHLKSIVKAMAAIKAGGEAYADVNQAVEAWDSAKEELKRLESKIAKAQVNADEAEIWGEFDSQTIAQLRHRGITLRFFEVAKKDFKEEWSYQYPIEVVAEDSANVYFVIASQGDQEIELPVIEVKPPVKSTPEYQKDIEDYVREQVTLEQVLERATNSREVIEAESNRLREEFDFRKAMNSGDIAAEGSLVVIEGWSEKEHTSQIEDFARDQDVVFFAEEAREEFDPPIKLKNNFFARMFEPIGALYMLPRYNELDLTPFFAPFFMIFFGVCFGDAGYGLLFIVAILAMWKKIPLKFRNFAWLGLFLNISTVIFGLLTGNIFGIELVKVESLAAFKDYFIATENMFSVAIGMGVVQVMFGQILRIFNRAKRGGSFVYGLSSLGWVLLFISGGLAFVEVIPGFTTTSIAFYVMMSIAGFLILFMNSPKSNPFVNFGKGLYSCYEQATGVVGDLISYVRLFAIGLAGAIIAQVFNALSEGLSGNIPVVSWIVMAIILLIGHGLNIFISILGAFVHPVRLTFVEFFKNAEFDGGGRAFNPFKKIKN